MGLVSELRRRNVFRMAALYVVAAWLIMQVTEVLMDLAKLPDWIGPSVLGLLAIGFPITLIFSWFYELTPEGLSLEKDIDPAESITHVTGRRMDFIVISLLSAAVLLFAWHTWWPSVPTDKSIAVMAFENMSDDPEQEFFSDGISEELLNTLSQVDDLRVISRSSSFSFKGKDFDIPTIAEKLNVAHVLEGSVRRMGDSVRITAQLIDAHTDSHLWSETYTRELTTQNIFAIQHEIAAAITGNLRATLSLQDEADLRAVPTTSLEAYQAYLLGKQRMIRRSRDSLTEAASYFQEAINLDPDYAVAYVGLADAHMLLGVEGELLLDELVATVEPALTMALSLDEELAPAYASLGLLREKTGYLGEAEAAYKRAIQLDPNYPTAFHWYGNLLNGLLARPRAAIPLLRRAVELDPLSPVINLTLGEALEGAGEFEEALALYRKAMEIEPAYPSPYAVTAHHHRFVYGQLDEAIRWYREGIALDPGRTLVLSNIGFSYLDLGDDEKAEYWINRGLSLGPEKYASPNRALASLQRYRGQDAEAAQTARKLLQISPGNSGALATLVAVGRYREALDYFSENFPELVCIDEPDVSRANLFRAIHLSLALERTGSAKCAELLLDKAIERMQTMPRLGTRGYWFADVEVLARQGRSKQALAAMQAALAEGARSYWWAQLAQSPHTVSLRTEPEFQAMLEQIRSEMAVQLERLRDMEARGNLTPIPD